MSSDSSLASIDRHRQLLKFFFFFFYEIFFLIKRVMSRAFYKSCRDCENRTVPWINAWHADKYNSDPLDYCAL